MVLLLVWFFLKPRATMQVWICDYYGLGGLQLRLHVFVSGKLSPAHLNPAVTIGVALKGGLPWASVFPYILAQFAGGYARSDFGLVAIQTSL